MGGADLPFGLRTLRVKTEIFSEIFSFFFFEMLLASRSWCSTQDPKSESGGTGAADREGQGRTPLTFGGCLGARVGEVHAEEQVLLGLYEEAREVSLHGGKLFNLILH